MLSKLSWAKGLCELFWLIVVWCILLSLLSFFSSHEPGAQKTYAMAFIRYAVCVNIVVVPIEESCLAKVIFVYNEIKLIC